MDKKIKLTVQGLTNSQTQSGAYALILSDDGPRRVPVIIGTFEAQSIAIALEKIKLPRPFTHDLFITMMQATEVRLKEVFIHTFNDGVFYSELVLDKGGQEIRLDSRTSDAIALALRAHVDIYMLESIVEKCHVVIDDDCSDDEEVVAELNSDDALLNNEMISQLNDKEIAIRLDRAITDENYEYAKLYNDELQRRKNAQDS